MSALIARRADPDYPAEIVGVISNRPDAAGLDIARALRHPRAVDRPEAVSPGREAHEAARHGGARRARPDLVCLAGFMRLLSRGLRRAWHDRMINIHPSLLPLFHGLDTHERALAAGVRIHGCTVHFVTERMDDGPIIAQAAIAIESDDTPDSLAERLLRAEHRLYPHALKLVLDGAVRMSNGRAVFRAAASLDEDPLRIADGPPILVSPDARRH